MDGPADWGAVEQPQEGGPAAWGAQPQQTVNPAFQPSGNRSWTPLTELPDDVHGLTYSQAIMFVPVQMYRGLRDMFLAPGKALQGQMTPEQEMEFAGNAALTMLGGSEIARPGLGKAIGPAVKEFQETVIAPGLQKMAAEARPPANTPEGVMAQPEVRDAIVNGPVNRANHVPYEAGASKGVDATTNIDKSIPEIAKLPSGASFDTATPLKIHEQVEKFVMDKLTAGGMDNEAAYRVGHWEYAERAEDAWYASQGIDPREAEAWWQERAGHIEHEPTSDTPPNLYDKPYPHDSVSLAHEDTVATQKPTPEEIAQAQQILGKTPEELGGHLADFFKARELGVIGRPDGDPSINELPPREAGQRVMAAVRRPDDKITAEPGQTPWRQRWEQTLDKMATPADVRRVINGIVEANDEFQLARQGDMGPAQVKQLSQVTGIDSQKIDLSGTSDKIKTDAEMRNVVEAFRSVSDRIRKAAADGDIEKFTEAELQRDLLLDGTLATKQLVALRAEFGRAGNLLQDFYRAQREAEGLKEFFGEKLGRTEDDIRDRMRMIADAPPDALPKILESTRNQKPGWLFWAWQQGLISGPVTHTKYAEVNSATLYLERVIVPEVAAAIGKMRGDKVSLSAPLWANVGLLKGVPDAFRGSVQAFKTGLRVPLESELKLAERGEVNPQVSGAQTAYTQNVGPEWGIWKNVFNEDQLATAAKVLGVPGRAANALHTFYKILGERGSAELRAYENAASEGAKGEKFDQRYEYHRANPSDEDLQAIVNDAYSGTFMQKLGDKIGTLAHALRSNPVTKWLFPFQHIPWNIERMTAMYSPVGFLDIKGYTTTGQALRGQLGKPAQNLALARVVVGTTIAGYFVHKALSGEATADYPLDPKERRRWALLGIQPNSVRIGDEWYSTQRLGPPGNLARIGANLGEIIRNYNGQDEHALMKAFGAFGLAIVNQLADETGFETTRNFIDIMEGRQNVERFLAWQAGSFLPMSSLTSQTASFMDPDMRVAGSFIDGLKYRIPFLREQLLPKRDPLYGEPIHNPGYHTIFRQNPAQIDPVKHELDRIGYYPMPPRKQIGGVKLTDALYDEYEATAGPQVKRMLTDLMQSPTYQGAPQAKKIEMARGTIKTGRALGQQAMFAHHPELVQQARQKAEAAILGH